MQQSRLCYAHERQEKVLSLADHMHPGRESINNGWSLFACSSGLQEVKSNSTTTTTTTTTIQMQVELTYLLTLLFPVASFLKYPN